MKLFIITTNLDNRYYVVAKNIENAIKSIKLQGHEDIKEILKISNYVIMEK